MFLLVFLGVLFSALAAEPRPGQLPVPFPAVATDAREGHWILCPPRSWLDEAFNKGASQQTFILYASTMKKPGKVESQVADAMGKLSLMPNSIIVPLKPGQKANPGQVVLTWWQSGSGMMRAIVVKGGTPTMPRVLYLDMDFSNPSGCAQKTDNLKIDSFQMLSHAWEPGTSVAYQESGSWKHAQVLKVSGNKVLALGFAGSLKSLNKEDCRSLPVLPPALKPGTLVIARTSYGTMEPATVKKIDKPIGRVFVKFQKGARSEEAVAFGNLIEKL